MLRKINVLIVALVLIIAACNDTQEKTNNSSKYEDTKGDLKHQEEINLSKFISYTGTWKKNIGGKFVINGYLSNDASLANYKDYKIRVDFYNNNQKKISSDIYTIYEKLRSGQMKAYTLKVKGPKDAKSIGFKTVDATSF